MMARYRHRPIEVEAEQWFPDRRVEGVRSIRELKDWEIAEELLRVGFDGSIIGIYSSSTGFIRTPEGGYIVNPGDWVVRKGHNFYPPISADVFEQMYEEET